jgi:hypothetical protein
VAKTVTATQGGSTAAGMTITVKVLTGASATQNGQTAKSSAITTPQLAITPNAAGNQVYGAVSANSASNYTPAATTTFSSNNHTSGPALGTYRSTAVTTTSPTTYGATAPSGIPAGQISLAMAEIVAASSGSLAEDASSPSPVTVSATTVSTAGFTPPPGTLLVAMVATSGGQAGTLTVTVTDSDSLAWTQLTDVSGTSLGNTGVWIAFVPAQAAQPGQTWARRLRPRSRARLGPQGLCAAGLAAAAAVTVQAATPARQPPPVPHSPPPARAHVGSAGRNAGGIASAIVTPLGSPARPRPFVFRSPAPARARWHGNAGPAPAAVTAYQRPPPLIPRRRPGRALWRGYGSRTVTPLGTSGPAWRAQPRRAAPARAVWHGNAGPAAVAPAAPQAYQHPPGQARRPAPRRGQWHGNAGPAGAAPSASAVPRPLPQPHGRPPRRAVWRGGASQVVTPPGTPAARPAPKITSRPRARVLWHGGSGAQPAAAVTAAQAPRRVPQPSRRKPARAVWRYIRGLVNAPPPPPSPGTLTAATAPGSTLTAADAPRSVLTAGTGGSALTAATAAQGGSLTAGTQSTGGPS